MMSTKSRGIQNKKHKSAADTKADFLARAIKKVGGQNRADELLTEWDIHRRSEKLCDRKKWESDGFLRGLILSHDLSRKEVMAFFKIGRYKYDRLKSLNPALPIPKRRPNDNAVSAEDKEFIRIFMKAMEIEPGYPCHHRSTPIYMADPNVTFVSLHSQYKGECQERNIRALSYDSFKKIVKFLMPTLHLGRTKKDSCNACFSLELQIKDPETSEELKQELIASKELHLQDAINTRRAINKLVKSVQNKVAPGDPPLIEEPVFIPACFKDPLDRLNRPLVVDYEEGRVGLEEIADPIWDDDFDMTDAVDETEVEQTEVEQTEAGENNHRILRVTVQDFGAGIPLPFYGANQPNHDYYASNITLHNMNFVDCATGRCHISYFDERQAGKDGNSVCSLRWNDLKLYLLENQSNLPLAECKVLDNCVGQNKSNTTHKCSMHCSLLVFPEGVTDIYYKVGHSHNQSDAKTGPAAKAMSKKNHYTPQAVAKEVNKVKGLFAEVLHERSDVFYDWKSFLDKHFPNMDPGFTGYYIFQFKNGVVDYKELNEAGEEVVVKSKVFCANPETVKKFVLRELFNLSATSNTVEIIKAKLRLPLLPMKRISQKKIESMRTLYSEIPRHCRWFYPEGEAYQDDPPSVRNRGLGGVLPHQDGGGLQQQDGGGLQQQDGGGLQQQDNGGLQQQDGGGLQHQEGGVQGHDVPEQDQEESRRGDGSERGDGQVDHPHQVGKLTISNGKKPIGRPKKVQSVDSGQLAIHRFFSASKQGHGDPPATATFVAGPSGAGTVTRGASNAPVKDLIDEENYSSDSSDESIHDCDTGNAAKRMKFKPLKVTNLFQYEDDSDDDFGVTLDSRGASYQRTEVVGSKDNDENDKPVEILEEYGVDLNHNAGKIVMKLVKK